MSDLITRTDDLAREIGRDMGAVQRAQDEIDRRLAALSNRLAQPAIDRYAPRPANAPAPSQPDLPTASDQGGVGMDARTGAALDGWEHVRQSIGKILATRIGSRVMLRDFGSSAPQLIDANATGRVILSFIVAVAEALERWEPRFRLLAADLTKAGPDGVFALELAGIYFPRGHLGDFSAYERREALLPIANAAANAAR